jgi:Fic family protein
MFSKNNPSFFPKRAIGVKMDARFTAPSGELVSLGPRGEVAFVPNPLPAEYTPPARLVEPLVEAREMVGELRGIGKTLPDHALLTRPLRQREALRSSSLEGTYATPAELLAYERDPRDPVSKDDRVNDWREVNNYQRALDHGQKLVEEGYPFSEWLIRQLHQILLGGVRGDDKSPGEIRTAQVHIGAGNRFTPPPQEHVAALLRQLEIDTQATVRIDPLIRAFMVHYQFETIHPFRDGNGRVGRLLMALMIYRLCDFDMPWLYLSEYFEKHKDDYIDRLYAVSAVGDWDGWIELCLLATIEVGRSTVRRVRQLLDIKEDYERKIRAMNGRDRLVHIVPKLFSSPIVTYADLRRELSISYPTARDDMGAMVDAGILVDMGGGNPRTFYARDIFTVAYSDEISL